MHRVSTRSLRDLLDHQVSTRSLRDLLDHQGSARDLLDREGGGRRRAR